MPNFERLKSVAVQQVRKLEDVITNILQRIQEQVTSLRDFANNLSTTNNREDIKKNLIVSFLAILELLKQNIIIAHQEDGDIKISKI
ncbi:MAG: hypothetical protein ORO03_01240 [Alphaproteobacteria bacterium]|nr:hypothetical protein [Alphaproteobacteria bacterium]